MNLVSEEEFLVWLRKLDPAIDRGTLRRFCQEEQIPAVKLYERNKWSSGLYYDRDAFLISYKKTKLGAAYPSCNLWSQIQEAYRQVDEARRDGKIVSGPCEICQDPWGCAHHQDYTKPLEVRYLCQRHHLQYHRQLRKGNGFSLDRFVHETRASQAEAKHVSAVWLNLKRQTVGTNKSA